MLLCDTIISYAGKTSHQIKHWMDTIQIQPNKPPRNKLLEDL